MSHPPQVVGVVAARHRDEALEACRVTIGWLTHHGMAVRVEPRTARGLGHRFVASEDYLAADLVLVFGGDGTVISTLRAAGPRGVAVLGVNFGTVGFLTEIAPEQLEAALDAIRLGQYTVTDHLMLHAVLADGDATSKEAVAANDVVIKAQDPAHVLQFILHADGDAIAEFPADGLILSTPTGSTAYNLSAGGPVVVPDLAAMIVTPICPHTLATRPLVLPADLTLTVHISAIGRQRRAVVSIDGRTTMWLGPGSTLTVKQAPYQMRLARLRSSSFFDSLRGKLRWGKPK